MKNGVCRGRYCQGNWERGTGKLGVSADLSGIQRAAFILTAGGVTLENYYYCFSSIFGSPISTGFNSSAKIQFSGRISKLLRGKIIK